MTSPGWEVPKSALQKTYEKFAMIRLNPEHLGVMIASDGDGRHHIILALMDEDGKSAIPVADLLHGNAIARLTPLDFGTALNKDFQTAFGKERRSAVRDFDAELTMEVFMGGLLPGVHLPK